MHFYIPENSKKVKEKRNNIKPSRIVALFLIFE